MEQGTVWKLGWESGMYSETLQKKVEQIFLTVSVDIMQGSCFIFNPGRDTGIRESGIAIPNPLLRHITMHLIFVSK